MSDNQQQDVSSLVERLEAFEERVGVRFEALFAKFETDLQFLTVNGELHPRDGAQLKQDIEVIVDAYDSEGRLGARSSTTYSADSFFGFETFSLFLTDAPLTISKIRVYPKPR